MQDLNCVVKSKRIIGNTVTASTVTAIGTLSALEILRKIYSQHFVVLTLRLSQRYKLQPVTVPYNTNQYGNPVPFKPVTESFRLKLYRRVTGEDLDLNKIKRIKFITSIKSHSNKDKNIR